MTFLFNAVRVGSGREMSETSRGGSGPVGRYSSLTGRPDRIRPERNDLTFWTPKIPHGSTRDPSPLFSLTAASGRPPCRPLLPLRPLPLTPGPGMVRRVPSRSKLSRSFPAVEPITFGHPIVRHGLHRGSPKEWRRKPGWRKWKPR